MDVSRRRKARQQNRYRYFVSDHDMKQYEKTFFQRPAVLIFEVHSRFWDRGLYRNQGEGACSLSQVS